MLVQSCELVGCCVAVEGDRHADCHVAGVAVRVRSEERPQVEVALEVDRKVVDLDAEAGGVGRVADGQAVAECAEQLLDRVRGGVGAAEADRLVGPDRCEVADRGL